MSRQKGEESELRELGAERGQKRGGSTSIRTTHATTAAAEWLARTRGMSINGAYSHAIALLADGTKWHGVSFDEVYHPSDGVFWCNLFLVGLTKETEDRRRAEFVSAHRPFFFVKKGKEWRPDEQNIAVLWPHVDYMADHWGKRKETNAWASGERMQELLREALIDPPEWGPKARIER